GRFQPEAPAIAVNSNVFVGADDALVAVEYEAKGAGADVVVFPIAAAKEATEVTPAAPAAPAPGPGSPPGPGAPPGPGSPAGPGQGNAYDRAMARGGVWEQRMLPCDQAGVRLTLKKDRTFALRVDTKCEGKKDTTQLAGKWASEGATALSLAFENAGGPTE